MCIRDRVSATPEEPESLGSDESIGSLLDEAEEIVRSAGPDIFADIEREREEEARANRGLRKFFRRKKRGN